jgi:hypothetical protein
VSASSASVGNDALFARIEALELRNRLLLTVIESILQIGAVECSEEERRECFDQILTAVRLPQLMAEVEAVTAASAADQQGYRVRELLRRVREA